MYLFASLASVILKELSAWQKKQDSRNMICFAIGTSLGPSQYRNAVASGWYVTRPDATALRYWPAPTKAAKL